MKLQEHQAAFSQDVAQLINYIFLQGYSCTIGEVFRTPEQAKLYAQVGKGIPNSLHCKRLAIDLNVFTLDGRYLDKTEDYELFGRYWESLDTHYNRWGGRFSRLPDGNHFERKED